MSQTGTTITPKILERVRHAIRSFRKSEAGGAARNLFALLIALMFAISGLNVCNSYVGRDFISAIEHKNAGEFWLQAALYLVVFALSTAAAVFFRFAEERLGLLWREWQTRQALGGYLDKGVYYHLAVEGEFENPDQRIAEDIRAFTTITLSFVLMMLNATFTAVAFSGVLWSISPLLFGVAVVYAFAGSVLTIIVGRRLVGLNYSLSDREANFRSGLIHVRDHAASVVMQHREERLKERLQQHLEKLVANARLVIAANRNVGFFTTGYNYLIQIMPALVVAPLFMSGKVEFGVVTQSAMAFAQLMGAFSLIVTQFQSISSYAAVIARLGVLDASIRKASKPLNSPVEIHEEPGRVAFENLTLRSKDGRVLILELNVSIPRGTRVVIEAPGGHVKAALFEATGGLCVNGEGRIVRPGADHIMFLPEQPYLPEGTVRELLVPAARYASVTDAQIEAVLKSLSIDSVIRAAGGINLERDWSKVLSQNELVLLSVAQVLLVAPDFVLLDRLTHALDPANVKGVLGLLSRNSITYIALGKGDARLAFFDALLHIFPDGTWKWKLLAESRQTDDVLHLPSAHKIV